MYMNALIFNNAIYESLQHVNHYQLHPRFRQVNKTDKSQVN